MSVSDTKEVDAVAAARHAFGQASEVSATLRIDAARPLPAPAPITADAQAVSRGLELERELDRLHAAVLGQQSQIGQGSNWLIAAQAILLHAYLTLLIVTSFGIAPFNFWLLGGVALLGLSCVTVQSAAMRSGRLTLSELLLRRRAVEIELAAVARREPNLPKTASTSGIGWLALAFGLMWVGLIAYTTALWF